MKGCTSLASRLLSAGALVVLTALWSNVARAQFPGPDEWYVRLTVTADNLADPGNGLGRIEGGSEGYDGYDLEELPPFDPPYLTIVFPHPEWGAHAGDYTVDFREQRHGAGGAWSFEARSDVARAVTISWEVVERTGEEVLARSRLFDQGTGATVQPAPGCSYSIPMVGVVHGFRWEVDALPVVEAGPSQTADAGEVVSLAPSTFSDEDDVDQHVAEVDWGDGTVEAGMVDQQANTVSASHVFPATGSYTVEVCVRDEMAAAGCDTLLVSVECSPGDVNGVGGIANDDLAALVGHIFGQSVPCPEQTGDGTVDAADLAEEVVLVWTWGAPPPPDVLFPLDHGGAGR